MKNLSNQMEITSDMNAPTGALRATWEVPTLRRLSTSDAEQGGIISKTDGDMVTKMRS